MTLDPSKFPRAIKRPMPATLLPMKFTEVPKAFSRENWIFELKLDGFRALGLVDHGAGRILSGNGNEIQRQFPSLTQVLAGLPVAQAIFDGELVCFDAQGLPNFSCMQSRFHTQGDPTIAHLDRATPATFCVFDLLYLDGYDLRGCPLSERRGLLEAMAISSPHIRVLDRFEEDGEALFEHAKSAGFEGVVGKNLDSVYSSGTRTRDWLKVKRYHTEDFIVGGYTPGTGGRSHTFGTLLLGRPEGVKITFVGTSGGGFSEAKLRELLALLEPLRTKENPFSGKVNVSGEKFWVEPRLWVEISFQAWTGGGHVRIPVFKRIRTDR